MEINMKALKKSITELPCDPTVQLMSIYPGGQHTVEMLTHPFYGCTVHDSQDRDPG